MTTIQPGPSEGNLVRCHITGRMVPADEVVTIQGYQVCAEGKAELLERLRSGELLPGELRRPSILRRLGALIVDSIVLGVVNMLVMMAAMVMIVSGGDGNQPLVLAGQWGAGILTGLIAVAYFTLMHASNGQSLGKMAAKLKVVRPDGTPIDMRTSAVRALAYQGVSLLLVIPMVLLAAVPMEAAAIAAVVVQLLAGGWGLADIIVALVDSAQQRSLHDRIAGTRVIHID